MVMAPYKSLITTRLESPHSQMMCLMRVTRPHMYSQTYEPRQVHTWPLWVVSIPRIKSNPPFFMLSINPHTLSSSVEYCGITYHGRIIYGHARNKYGRHEMIPHMNPTDTLQSWSCVCGYHSISN